MHFFALLHTCYYIDHDKNSCIYIGYSYIHIREGHLLMLQARELLGSVFFLRHELYSHRYSRRRRLWNTIFNGKNSSIYIFHACAAAVVAAAPAVVIPSCLAEKLSVLEATFWHMHLIIPSYTSSYLLVYGIYIKNVDI